MIRRFPRDASGKLRFTGGPGTIYLSSKQIRVRRSRGVPTSSRPQRRGHQLSSRWLASALVAGYTTVSALVGAVLLVAPKQPGPGTAAPSTTYVYAPPPPAFGPADAATPAPRIDTQDPGTRPNPSNVALPVPEGYQRVAGPGGLVTTVPKGWTITRSSGPGSVQATDPADPARHVRYGGAPAPAADLLQSHVDYEATFAKSKPGFQRLSLGTTRYHGVLAVDWEFEHDSAGVRKHVHSMYWRVDGIEYFVYAAANADRWAETVPVYHALIDNASP